MVSRAIWAPMRVIAGFPGKGLAAIRGSPLLGMAGKEQMHQREKWGMTCRPIPHQPSTFTRLQQVVLMDVLCDCASLQMFVFLAERKSSLISQHLAGV